MFSTETPFSWPSGWFRLMLTNPTMTPGGSTALPSINVDLGRYVTVRPRKDGTARVLFEVPKRLRPSGWSAAIALPLEGERRGDLNDLREVTRIQADAKALYDQLRGDRVSADQKPPPGRNFAQLIRQMEKSQRYKAAKPRTQKGYSFHTRYILAWSESVGHPDPTKLTRAKVEDFLGLFDDHPTTRRHIKIVLKMVMDEAVNLGWRLDNPAARIKMGAPKAKLRTWEQEDVDFWADACVEADQPAVAAYILTQWEIGQRPTDARLFQYRRQYDPTEGVFRFWSSKTEQWITVPVSQKLRDLLGDGGNHLYLFFDARTDKPFTEQRLSHVFAAIRDPLVAAGRGRRLVLRALRHSCVVQLARAGCDIPEIASITGHTIASVHSILQHYLPRDNQLAWSAQAKRGLIPAQNAS